MLVLSRKKNEDVVIYAGGQRIVVKLVRVQNNKVRIGIEADVDVSILRGELDTGAPPEHVRKKPEVPRDSPAEGRLCP